VRPFESWTIAVRWWTPRFRPLVRHSFE
jgi:hypothetical protein